MGSSNNNIIKRWLSELVAEKPDLKHAIQLAKAVTEQLYDAPELRQFAQALGSDMEDHIDCDTCQAQLPDFLHAQQYSSTNWASTAIQFMQLRNHLSLCPYCTAAYVQVAEWIINTETDSTPVAATYPDFNFDFLSQSIFAPATPAFSARLSKLIERARAEGRQWLDDSQGGIYLLFGAGLQIQSAAVWAVKSSDAQALLGRVLLTADELPGWEIEATAFATNDQYCRIEVSLYCFERSRADLAGIAVMLNDGMNEQTAFSDQNGLVEFDLIRRDLLEAIVIRVTP